MKKILLLVFFLASLACTAQKIEKFFNYRWEPCAPADARFYALIEFKDSLWARSDYFIQTNSLQMQGAYRDSACKIPEGLFHYFHANGKLSSTGRYVNGKRQYLWLDYYSNGMMEDSTFYINGLPSGVSLSWHPSGYMKDSIVYNNNIAMHVSWFDNGNLSSAGYLINDSLHGKWVFYHKNGNTSAIEVYKRGQLIRRQYFSETGQEMTDTSDHDRPAEYNGGQKAWEKFMLSQLYFPAQYQITGGDKAVVVITAAIDEEGNLTEPEVTSPFHPSFNKIALDMMKKSKKWKPAISHNRNVKYYFRQPVTFAQIE